MRVLRSYKTEVKPNDHQKTLFSRCAGVSRFTWNWALARETENHKNGGKYFGEYKNHKALNELKKTDFPWMYDVSKCVPQSALIDLHQAFRRFFKTKHGYPKFKSRNRGKSSFRVWKSIHVKYNKIKLPRIGWIRFKEYGYIPIEGIKILSATVSERAGHWFVSVACEQNIEVPENHGTAVGVDLGITHLATLSDGTYYESPRPLKRKLRKLKHLNQDLSRKKKGSNNRTKAKQRLSVLYYRIACVRNDALHKLTTYLAKNHSKVVIEDLAVSGMLKNHHLAQAISDLGWGEFRRQLEYKCIWYGSELVVADRFFPSSKMCSNCGNIKKDLKLSTRVYKCKRCGLVIDRDLNAARNLVSQVAVSSTETLNACGEVEKLDTSVRQETGTHVATQVA